MRTTAIAAVLMAAGSGCAANQGVRPEECELGTMVEVANGGGYQAEVFLIHDDGDPTLLGTVGPGQSSVFSVGSGRAWVRLRRPDGGGPPAAVRRLGGGVRTKYYCR